MQKLIFYIIIVFCVAFNHHKAAGNNLQLYDTKVIDASHIQFKITWENSWNLEGIEAPYNHDAAWVFIKFRKDGRNWQHLNIKFAQSQEDVPTPLYSDVSSDNKGVFIKRKPTGAGKIEPTEIIAELSTPLQTGIYDVQVFGIEMVCVEEGPFFIGDGISYNSFSRGDKRAALRINSEAELIIGKDSINIYDTSQYAPAGSIPASYPKGFGGFYCMKYEISQEQYADFLNSLSYNQQKSRTYTSPESAPGTLAMTTSSINRNGITIEKPAIKDKIPAVYSCNATKDNIFNNNNDGQNRACNFLNWADIAAYLDWAALRPMTEFEFEKICRGPLLPVSREFAWGTDKVTDANTIIKDGTAEESVNEKLPAGYGLASHGYTGPQGPLRAGFGGSDSSGRLSIGAAYFGALELSGNLVEHCVTINEKGLQFDGRAGNGELSTSGDADVETWPGKDGDGAGYRGGGWLSGIQGEFRDLAVSDRFYAGLKPTLRRTTSGGRGVRFK